MAYNLDQSYTTGQDNDDSGIGKHRITSTNNQILGQSFTPTLSGKLNRVELYIKRIGSPSGNIWVEIHSDGADPTAAAQQGADSATVNATSGVGTSYAFVAFDFVSGITLSAGTEYWMLLYGDYSLSSTDNVYWGVDTSSPSYSGGIFGRYGNGASAWEDITTYDGLFKTYHDDPVTTSTSTTSTSSSTSTSTTSTSSSTSKTTSTSTSTSRTTTSTSTTSTSTTSSSTSTTTTSTTTTWQYDFKIDSPDFGLMRLDIDRTQL